MSLPHPFDEEAFLRRQEGLEAAVESGTRFYDAQLARHLREVRQLHAELIATRQHARTLAARVAEFEQGQGMLTLNDEDQQRAGEGASAAGRPS